MSKRFARTEILSRLRTEIDAKRSILVVGAGNGLVARCAERGGVDLIVSYSTGYFRLNGLPSLVGHLPIGDANEISVRIGREAIIPVVRHTPIIGGVYAVDPTRTVTTMLDAIQAAGFSGVINFPSVGRFKGSWRQELEASGLGFERELQMVREARERDLFSMAYVYDDPEAEQMAKAGVDVLIGHVGLTKGGDIGAKRTIGLKEAAERIEIMFDKALAVRDDLILLSHGALSLRPKTRNTLISTPGRPALWRHRVLSAYRSKTR